MEFNKIQHGIFVGSCPKNTADIKTLCGQGITAVLNFQTQADFDSHGIVWQDLQQQYRDNGQTLIHYPIVDFDDDDLLAKLSVATTRLDELVAQHEKVYVHCNAGKQRSPSVVIAWLFMYGRYDLPLAIASVMNKRRCDPPLGVIEQFASQVN